MLPWPDGTARPRGPCASGPRCSGTWPCPRLPCAPAGAITAVDLGLAGLVLLRPAAVTFDVPAGQTASDALKVMVPVDGAWVALPSTLDDDGEHVSTQVSVLTTFGLVPGHEDCANALDDDGDGATDCLDAVCARDLACTEQGDGGYPACMSPSDCATGDDCVDGGCQTPQPTHKCTNDNQCVPPETCVARACTLPPADGGTNAPDAGTQRSCQNDHQCATGESCVNGSCAALDGGQGPDAGVAAGCNSDADCLGALKCSGHKCR